MQFPITLGLHCSRFLDAALGVTAFAAGVTGLAWPLPIVVRLTILLGILIFYISTRKKLRPLFSAIRIERDGQVSVLQAGKTEFSSVELLPVAIVHPFLTIVRLKTENGRLYWLIAAVDTLEGQDFRRLRVFLRWRAKFSGQAGDV